MVNNVFKIRYVKYQTFRCQDAVFFGKSLIFGPSSMSRVQLDLNYDPNK